MEFTPLSPFFYTMNKHNQPIQTDQWLTLPSLDLSVGLQISLNEQPTTRDALETHRDLRYSDSISRKGGSEF
jgi:hypothetical protein